jgi:hypothetical protein
MRSLKIEEVVMRFFVYVAAFFVFCVHLSSQTALSIPATTDLDGDGLRNDVVCVDYVHPYQITLYLQEDNVLYITDSFNVPWLGQPASLMSSIRASGDIIVGALDRWNLLTNFRTFEVVLFRGSDTQPIIRIDQIPLVLASRYAHFYQDSNIKNIYFLNVDRDVDFDGKDDFVVFWKEHYNGYGVAGPAPSSHAAYFVAHVGTSRGLFDIREISPPPGSLFSGTLLSANVVDSPTGNSGEVLVIGYQGLIHSSPHDTDLFFWLFDSNLNPIGYEQEDISPTNPLPGWFGEVEARKHRIVYGKFIAGVDNIAYITFPEIGNGGAPLPFVFSRTFTPNHPFVGRPISAFPLSQQRRFYFLNDGVADYDLDGKEELASIVGPYGPSTAVPSIVIFNPSFPHSNPSFYRDLPRLGAFTEVQCQYGTRIDVNNDGLPDLFFKTVNTYSGMNRRFNDHVWINQSTPGNITGTIVNVDRHE